MCVKSILIAPLMFFSVQFAVEAGDAYFRVPLKDLEITEGKLTLPVPEDQQRNYSRSSWRLDSARRGYAVIDGNGEAYLDSKAASPYGTGIGGPQDGEIVVRAVTGADVTGLLVLPRYDLEEGVKVRFRIPAKKGNDKHAKDFYEQKAQHYQSLWAENIPGGAWFRHELRLADRQLGADAQAAAANRFFGRQSQLEDTFDLFSGSRAIAENLQLDRALPAAKEKLATVDISSLSGITIAEIDWSKHLKKDAAPALDPLAAAIPADQHAVFFSSFAKLLEVADHLDEQGTRLLNFAEPRSEDARTRQRYERQLGLSTSALSRLLGPALVKSVAVTGSDPYFISGTDVAVLFEAANPAALHALLMARIAAGAHDPAASAADGKIEGTNYTGFRTPDRKICSYIARLGNVIVVTNSLAQLEQLAKAQEERVPTIASLDEYRFFRTRYPLGAVEESAFLFISDPTIRRWCGPRWRIANSRRVREQAVMSELEAVYLDDLVRGAVKPGPLHADLAAPNLGQIQLTAAGVSSSTLGTLEFQTPIIERPLDKATTEEADFYKRWRDTYQQNWNWAFDPIGLRITSNGERLGADLTVMPLIVNTQYHWLTGLAQGAEIKPGAGDPHDAPFQFVMAFNRDSEEFHRAGNLVESLFATPKPFSWVGSSISVYADEDPFWGELAKQKNEEDKQKFLEENFSRLPVAAWIAVDSPLKLTAFVVGLRGMVEQTAPGMVSWESLKHNDQPYVKVRPTDRGKRELPPGVKEPAVYYAITRQALIVTLNEALLKRALDRDGAREKKSDDKPAAASEKAWLGSSACLRLDGAAIGMLSNLFRGEYEDELRLHSWNNLPILNEWKRQYRDRDPVELHEQFFHTRLVCPGGGSYVWNDKWQTMESTIFGHPAQPKTGTAVPPLLSGFSNLDFGLTFEEKGLRVRLDLKREKKK